MGLPTDSTEADHGSPTARFQEVVVLLQQGALEEAGRRLARLLDQAPGHAATHQLAAQLATRRGRPDLALQHMGEACRLAPDRAEIHFQLACLQAHGGQLQPALEHFRIATRRLPDFAEGWLYLGTTLVRARRDAEALAPLRRAHELAPDDARALRALADVEFRTGWPADALPLWQALLERRADDVQARLRTGESLSRLGFQAQAVGCFREGVQLLPDSDALWLALAQAEEDNGDRDAARRSYEQALALHPEWPFALGCLLGLLRGQAPDALLDRAALVLQGDALADDDRALLGYALGKAHDARGDYRRAMACWHDANAARRRVAGTPDPTVLRQRVDRIVDAFRPELFAAAAASASDDERFVFIVGMPRSGTTLTEQILASHPQVHGCGELPDIGMVARHLAAETPATMGWPGTMALLEPDVLRDSIARYAAAATRHAPATASRLVDKEPLNFFHLGLIALMFPRARIIWCRRDPRDTAVSIYGENFALDETLATSLAGIGHYINQQARLMRHWQASLPLSILECRYEELVAAPEAQSRRLVEFIGLPWDPACLEFHSSTRAVQSPSRWQVRQPVHTRSAGRWRHYAADLDPLLEVLEADTRP